MSKSIKSFFETVEKKQTDVSVPPDKEKNEEENQGSASNIVSASSSSDVDHFRPDDSYVFPKKTVGKKQRSCQSSWFKKFSWLHYDQVKDAVFCILCKKHYDKLTAEHNKEDAYVRRGFNSWKKAPACFMDHQMSKCHKTALTYEAVVPKCGDIMEMTVSELQKQRTVERKYVIKIMECIRYLSRQGIALRGDNGNDNLRQLLKLVCKGDPELMKRLDNEGVSIHSWQKKYLHNDFQNELIELMARQVLLNKMDMIKTSAYYGIMADEYTDISNKELLSICVRWVAENFTAHEDFVGYYEIPNIKSDTIVAALKDGLIRMQLSLDNLRAQAYDGASNMLGKKSGVATQILADQPKALVTHCQGHSINLGVKNTMSNSKMMKDVMGTVVEIISLVKYSPKRERMLGDIKENIQFESADQDTEEPSLSLDKLCVTRWTVRGSAYFKVLANYESLMELWNACLLSGGLDTDVKARIIGVQKQMQEFQFFYGLCLGHRIFCISDNLSKTIQSESMSAVSGLHLAELTIETYRGMRTDESAALFCNTTVKKASNHSFVTKPSLPRKRKRPNYKSIVDYMQVEGYDDVENAHHPANVEDYFRQRYFETLDLVISSIKERFEQTAFTSFLNMETLLLNILQEKSYDQELQYATEVYTTDINAEAVRIEEFVFRTMFKSVTVHNFEGILCYIRTIPSSMQKLIPSIATIINLILVNPSTSCTPERSFSTARRLKTWLRSTMKSKRFNNLAILLTHKETTDAIDLVAVGNEFISKYPERKNHLGQFVQSDIV